MSYASEVNSGGFDTWLPNSYRFATEAEADGFIRHLREVWIPADFVRDTRIKKSIDPVNARWDSRRQEAVSLPAAPANEPLAMPAAAIEPEEPEQDNGPVEEFEEPEPLVDEASYRPRPTASKKLPWRRRFSIEVFRAFRDETRWYEREQVFETYLADTPKGYGLISDAIRDDLRNLLTHGNCRLEISRWLLDAFMTAHGGKAPDKSIDTGKRRLNASKKTLFEAYEALRIASDGANQKAQTAYNRAEKSYAAAGGDLSAWRSATSGEIVGADEHGPIRIDPPAMKNVWEILKVSATEFDWVAAAPAVSMLDLSRWLATPEGHAVVGWYSFGEWRGPAETSKDLIAALGLKPKLDLPELEAAELAAKMTQRKNLATRLELFDAVLSGEYFQKRLQLEKERKAKQQRLEKQYEATKKCKIPNLQKLLAKHGGDYSRISTAEWERFNREIEDWKDCVGCNDNWPDPNWRKWFEKRTAEIWE